MKNNERTKMQKKKKKLETLETIEIIIKLTYYKQAIVCFLSYKIS